MVMVQKIAGQSNFVKPLSMAVRVGETACLFLKGSKNDHPFQIIRCFSFSRYIVFIVYLDTELCI
jgi:hypothetical protein